jgi:sigma-E factor negative regulatory protein RseB
MMFTEVRFPEEIVDARFDEALAEHEERVAARAAQMEVPAALQAGASRIGSLPPGFRVTMRSIRQSADGSGVVEHVVLTDGLTAVSIFSAQQREASVPVFQGQSRMGAVHAFGRMIGTMHVTVIGEAPQETVRLIGESVQPLETPIAAPAPLPEAGTAVPSEAIAPPAP